MAQKGSYIFTNKKHPEQGIMSLVLGLLSNGGIIAALYLTFISGGESLPSCAMATVIATIFSIAGVILGILGKLKEDVFYVTVYLGLILNIIALGTIGYMIYAGVYGI